MYAGAWLQSPVAIPTPIVTAGFRCALLPTASATMTAQTTAKPHAVVMTIQPPFSAYEPFSETPATTPLPCRIRVIVPISSPRKPSTPISFRSARPIDPVERALHGFLPCGVQLRALRLRHRGLPAALDAPVAHELGAARPIADGDTGRVRGAERRRLRDSRPHDCDAKLVGLELHQELVRDHAAVDAQLLDRNAGILLHGFEHVARLIGDGFERRTRDVTAIRVAREARDDAARRVAPVRRE